jgi:proteasome lid subunit RPN8/RPN11
LLTGQGKPPGPESPAGASETGVALTLADGRSLRFTVRYNPGEEGGLFRCEGDDPPCDRCQVGVAEILAACRAGSADPLAEAGERVCRLMKRCGCVLKATDPEPAVQTRQARERVVPFAGTGLEELPGPRVRVVNPGKEAADGPASGARPAGPRVAVVPGARGGAEARALQVPEATYHLPSGSHVGIVVAAEACAALERHCDQSNRHGREVAGILVGFKHEVPGESGTAPDYHIVVTDILPVATADASGTHVKLDEETWRAIERECETRFTPHQKIRLGWYHTHPTQGIFFSGQDLDAHTVFTQAYQVALVVDPQRMAAGLFYWENHGRRTLGGPIHFQLRRGQDGPRNPAPAPAAPPTEVDAPVRQARAALFVLTAALAGFFFVLQPTWEAARLRRPGLTPGLTPEAACLLGGLVLLALRLTNLGFFQAPAAPAEPPGGLAWWRAIPVLGLLALAALAFFGAWVSPAPGLLTGILFTGLLALVFLETVQAGWYRRPRPWELAAAAALGRHGLSLMWWLGAALAFLGVLTLGWSILNLLFPFDRRAHNLYAFQAFLGVMATLIGVLILLLSADSEEEEPGPTATRSIRRAPSQVRGEKAGGRPAERA